jgi:hypothetical protein
MLEQPARCAAVPKAMIMWLLWNLVLLPPEISSDDDSPRGNVEIGVFSYDLAQEIGCMGKYTAASFAQRPDSAQSESAYLTTVREFFFTVRHPTTVLLVFMSVKDSTGSFSFIFRPLEHSTGIPP